MNDFDTRAPLEPRRTDGMAIVSVVLGAVLFLGPLTGVPAIVLGGLSIRRIRKSRGVLTGEAPAIVGVALGLVATLGGTLFALHFAAILWQYLDDQWASVQTYPPTPMPLPGPAAGGTSGASVQAIPDLVLVSAALSMYSNQNNGRLPRDFAELQSATFAPATMPPDCDWVLKPKFGTGAHATPWMLQDFAAPGQVMVMRQRQPRYPGGPRYALFADGRIRPAPAYYQHPVPGFTPRSSAMTIDIIADYQTACGEGPLWHPDEKRLYWTDIPTGRLFRYDPATGKHEQVYTGAQVGGFTIQENGALLLFMEKGAVKTWRDGQFEKTILEQIDDEVKTRFNDVIADPRGRVFCGTMPVKNERLGRLYRLDPDGSLQLLLENIGCSNGMGFTPDRKQLYYTDTPTGCIYIFDYDEATGDITNQRVFVDVKNADGSPGKPDGMTVDAEGCVWSALWGGSCVVRYAPDGTELDRITLPAKNITCPTFAGDNFEDLYITTALAGGSRDEPGNDAAGKLLRIRPGVKGAPEFRSRIGQ